MKTVTLREITLNITDGKHGDCEPAENSGYYFVSCKDVNNGTIDYANARQISERAFLETHKRTQLEPNDILITNSGTIGRMALVKDIPETYRTTFQKSVAIVKPDISVVLPTYLYYKLQNCVTDFVNCSNGSAQKNLLLGTMRKFQIDLHEDFAEQERLSSILAAYDNLIENNQKQIKLLEEAARRLYKEWFVDLRFPGYEDTPIVDGVPEGWALGELGDIAIDSGKKEKKEHRGQYQYYLPIDCLPKRSLAYTDKNDITLAESSLVAFMPNDILFGAMRPYFHKVVVARDKGLTRTTCFVINSKMPAYWAYLLLLLFSKDTVDYATQISVGTTMPYVRWKDFIHMPTLIPPEEKCDAFQAIVLPIIERISCLAVSSERLIQARDRLLPELMSGEIEV